MRRRELPGSITANSKQEALFVFFYSPEYMIGYIPENLEKYPDLLKFMVDISMTWEESIVLDSKPGDYVVYDRKDKYGVWYIVDISDEEEREVTLDLTFLQKGKKIPCPFCYRCH
ncbi:glycoside hydrolase family 97 C-terminal domain-containing protein [Cecembia rubra]|uniref:Glycosyl hydrolase family 97 n=1 Tax=Cecembia rubra TaxID=1485585 RepID=A0A2P8E2W3_9BACT|nr:glycoside hydrolase family 97 C-terminal domain-containing protein [Cecembia rubra]PSL03803.1 glycosyl hydrolase family 97 [Cecembia rubra]